MSSTIKIKRKVAWISLLPQLSVMGIIIFCYHLFIKSILLDFCLGAYTYLILSNALERGITHNHRKGMKLIKSGNYTGAMEEFQKSFEFFSKHSWLDKYRYLTMLSSSKYPYAEMALINIAYCYAQFSNVEATIEYYQKTLKLNPNNEMAKISLDLIASHEGKSE